MIRKIITKVGVTWIFLILVAIIFSIVAFTNFSLFISSLSTFWQLFLKILPILPLIYGLIFLSNLFLDPSKIAKYVGEKSGSKGWFISILGGIISTGPIYMWYPLLSDLKEKGMKTSFIATFLYNRAIKIPLMPMLILYFGWLFTLVLTINMIIFSVINGILVKKFMGVKK